MTDKVITHEEALELVKILFFNINEKTLQELNRTSKIYSKLFDYINQQEQFAKDVARFMVLFDKYIFDKETTHEMFERYKLEDKFRKVGKEE